MSPIVVVAVVFMLPVTFMVCPAPVVVIIVRVVPIRTRIGRSPPYSRDPYISSPVPVPIPIYPDVSRTWNRRPHLIAQRGRSNTDIYADSSKGRRRKCRSQDCTSDPFRFHCSLPLLQPLIRCQPDYGRE